MRVAVFDGRNTDCKHHVWIELRRQLDRQQKAAGSHDDKPVWTYTHAWKKVGRKAWGSISVLASCDSLEQVHEAKRKGYATALVLDHFEETKAHYRAGVKIVPCPQETGRVPLCTDCRLCFKDDLLRQADITIAFAAHSGGAKRMREKLTLIEGTHTLAAKAARA